MSKPNGPSLRMMDAAHDHALLYRTPPVNASGYTLLRLPNHFDFHGGFQDNEELGVGKKLSNFYFSELCARAEGRHESRGQAEDARPLVARYSARAHLQTCWF